MLQVKSSAQTFKPCIRNVIRIGVIIIVEQPLKQGKVSINIVIVIVVITGPGTMIGIVVTEIMEHHLNTHYSYPTHSLTHSLNSLTHSLNFVLLDRLGVVTVNFSEFDSGKVTRNFRSDAGNNVKEAIVLDLVITKRNKVIIQSFTHFVA